MDKSKNSFEDASYTFDEKRDFFHKIIQQTSSLQQLYVKHIAIINLISSEDTLTTHQDLRYIGSNLSEVENYLMISMEVFDTIHDSNYFSDWLEGYTDKRKNYFKLTNTLTNTKQTVAPKIFNHAMDYYNNIYDALNLLKKYLIITLKREHAIRNKFLFDQDLKMIITNTVSRFITVYDQLSKWLITLNVGAMTAMLAFIGTFHNITNTLKYAINPLKSFMSGTIVSLSFLLLNLILIIIFSSKDNKQISKYGSGNLPASKLKIFLIKYSKLRDRSMIIMISILIGIFIFFIYGLYQSIEFFKLIVNS